MKINNIFFINIVVITLLSRINTICYAQKISSDSAIVYIELYTVSKHSPDNFLQVTTVNEDTEIYTGKTAEYLSLKLLRDKKYRIIATTNNCYPDTSYIETSQIFIKHSVMLYDSIFRTEAFSYTYSNLHYDKNNSSVDNDEQVKHELSNINASISASKEKRYFLTVNYNLYYPNEGINSVLKAIKLCKSIKKTNNFISIKLLVSAFICSKNNIFCENSISLKQARDFEEVYDDSERFILILPTHTNIRVIDIKDFLFSDALFQYDAFGYTFHELSKKSEYMLIQHNTTIGNIKYMGNTFQYLSDYSFD